MLTYSFFNRDAITTAKALLGKIIYVQHKHDWLFAQIIETEAYFRNENGSHASLGFTEKRKALFMPPGTIYMYYSWGGDSLNVSCRGKGNAVLIKSGFPYQNNGSDNTMLSSMQLLNSPQNKIDVRPI